MNEYLLNKQTLPVTTIIYIQHSLNEFFWENKLLDRENWRVKFSLILSETYRKDLFKGGNTCVEEE